MGKTKRNHIIHIRFTFEEIKRIQQLANKEGLPISAFVRYRLLKDMYERTE